MSSDYENELPDIESESSVEKNYEKRSHSQKNGKLISIDDNCDKRSI